MPQRTLGFLYYLYGYTQIAYWIDVILDTALNEIDANKFSFTGKYDLALTMLLLIPCLSILTRRLHDINISGWFILTPFILLIVTICTALPYSFAIALTIAEMMCLLGCLGISLFTLLKSGTVGDNNYGPPASNTKLHIATINFNSKKTFIIAIAATMISSI